MYTRIRFTLTVLVIVTVLLAGCGQTEAIKTKEVTVPAEQIEAVVTSPPEPVGQSSIVPSPIPTVQFTPTITPTPDLAPSGAELPASPVTPSEIDADILAGMNCIVDMASDMHNVYLSTCGTETDDHTNGAVLVAPKSGGDIRLLAAGQVFPRGLVVHDENVFWVNGARKSENTIMRVSKNGGQVSTMVEDLNWITSMTVDEANVYWASCSELYDGSGAVMKMLKNGGTPEALVSEAACPWNLVLDGTNIYWGHTGLRTIDKDGGTPVTLLSDTDLLGDDARRDFPLRVRDESSHVYVGQIVKLDVAYVNFTIFIDNTGMFSCMDNHTLLVKMPKASFHSTSGEGTLELLASMPERVTEFAADDNSMYLLGVCESQSQVLRVSNSGEQDVIELENWDVGSQEVYQRQFAVDEMGIYWWGTGGNLIQKTNDTFTGDH